MGQVELTGFRIEINLCPRRIVEQTSTRAEAELPTPTSEVEPPAPAWTESDSEFEVVEPVLAGRPIGARQRAGRSHLERGIDRELQLGDRYSKARLQ